MGPVSVVSARRLTDLGEHTMVRIVVIAALATCGLAHAGPSGDTGTSTTRHADSMVKIGQPAQTAKVKGASIKAADLELVRTQAHDGTNVTHLELTVSKRKHRLTVERGKSATLIRLGDHAGSKSKVVGP